MQTPGTTWRKVLLLLSLLALLVYTLADIPLQAPGEHAVEWNPSALAGGVYYYRLTITPAVWGEPFVKTLPMTYLR